ncbi:hypothetical protein BT93_L5633 [Corymbia citriodora subsp. variegata]|uniref:ZF-HD dimerization-type domain-containing protein n=1 Tax=Corymbia citriodora subsp. variegata TaxID=360336 RepID=A0A8T0CRS7_CORYI|nr:hypothetical protein BT93_L5633 [Corymbia citriodora subsp. variegata]KAF7850301.1 hypothetical protein BT93_L5633 [Corymbia citriodora subsp. variegata]KAF7850302.1 hypothetical protein BT93_L5633 [Corymbia citriodora subsp. variegata]KAF7850303.1 hypothetical protein BT93_L5633 [Corymbia citriodora subsp. variegata]
MEPRSEEDQAEIPNSLMYDDPNPPSGDRKIDRCQNHVISPQTLDQPKPRIDHLLQPSIPTSSSTSAEFPKVRTSTQTMPQPVANFRYRECLKNHAVSIGGHVVDGCGEFMPSGDEGTPEFFRCAACGCHRNFHRKEFIAHGGSETGYMASFQYHHNENGLNYGQIRHAANSIPHLLHQSRQHHQGFSPGPAQPLMVAFGGGGEAESSSEDLGVFQRCDSDGGAWRRQEEMVVVQMHQSPKKRFRTKFSEEQKEKMMEFAEKLGWKMQKGDEDEVVKFCEEVGVKRQVFKVWMHNNKQATKRKQPC